MKIYIVIAAYNEEKNIENILKSLLNFNYNIIVVDDGSTDKTEEIVKKYPVILLKHSINRGQGASLATGTEYAYQKGVEIVVHFDADGQHLTSEISRIIEPLLQKEVEIVLGSKFLQKNKIPFFKKYFIIKPALLFNNLLTGIKLTDVHNGFRGLSRKALSLIKIKQDGMAHASEIIAEIKKHKLKYKEVPVTVIYNEFGQGLFSGFRILKDLIFNNLIK